MLTLHDLEVSEVMTEVNIDYFPGSRLIEVSIEEFKTLPIPEKVETVNVVIVDATHQLITYTTRSTMKATTMSEAIKMMGGW